MPGPARAIVINFEDAGNYIEPGSLEVGMDTTVNFCLLGLDNSFMRGKVHANLLLSETPAQWGAKIVAAIDAFAVSKGFTVAANQHIVPSFVKL